MGRLGFVPMSDQPFLLEDDTGEILLEDGTWLLLETLPVDPTLHEGGYAITVGPPGFSVIAKPNPASIVVRGRRP